MKAFFYIIILYSFLHIQDLNVNYGLNLCYNHVTDVGKTVKIIKVYPYSYLYCNIENKNCIGKFNVRIKWFKKNYNLTKCTNNDIIVKKEEFLLQPESFSLSCPQIKMINESKEAFVVHDFKILNIVKIRCEQVYGKDYKCVKLFKKTAPKSYHVICGKEL